jgi:hypothetical protein
MIRLLVLLLILANLIAFLAWQGTLDAWGPGGTPVSPTGAQVAPERLKVIASGKGAGATGAAQPGDAAGPGGAAVVSGTPSSGTPSSGTPSSGTPSSSTPSSSTPSSNTASASVGAPPATAPANAASVTGRARPPAGSRAAGGQPAPTGRPSAWRPARWTRRASSGFATGGGVCRLASRLSIARRPDTASLHGLPATGRRARATRSAGSTSCASAAWPTCS